MKFPNVFNNTGICPHITPKLVKIMEIICPNLLPINSFSHFIPRVCTPSQKQFFRAYSQIDVSRTLYEDK